MSLQTNQCCCGVRHLIMDCASYTHPADPLPIMQQMPTPIAGVDGGIADARDYTAHLVTMEVWRDSSQGQFFFNVWQICPETADLDIANQMIVTVEDEMNAAEPQFIAGAEPLSLTPITAEPALTLEWLDAARDNCLDAVLLPDKVQVHLQGVFLPHC